MQLFQSDKSKGDSLTKGALYRWSYGSIMPSNILTRCYPTRKQVRKARLRLCISAGLCIFLLVSVIY